jgi:hypothetical protein
MRWLAIVGVGLLLGGCGVLDEEGPAAPKPPDPAVYGPSTATKAPDPTLVAPRLVKPSAAVAHALDGGAIGVVDLSGAVAIEPESLDTAADVTLSAVRWSSWGAAGASGTARVRILTCQPSCAASGERLVAARIELSGVKTCSGRRYFSSGRVLLDSGEDPVTYLRAPC